MIQPFSAQDCTNSSCVSEGLMVLQKTKSEVTSAFRNNEDDAKHMHETHEDSDPEWDSAMYNPLTTGPPPDPDGSHAPLNETIPNNESALLEKDAEKIVPARRRREWATCQGVCSRGWCYHNYGTRSWCYCSRTHVYDITIQAQNQHCISRAGVGFR